jgi:hypothetical protein
VKRGGRWLIVSSAFPRQHKDLSQWFDEALDKWSIVSTSPRTAADAVGHMPDVSLTRGGVINGVPLSLTALRALLAPVIVTLALLDPDPRAFGICLALGFLSDVFDGIVARKLGIATPALRRLA